MKVAELPVRTTVIDFDDGTDGARIYDFYKCGNSVAFVFVWFCVATRFGFEHGELDDDEPLSHF